MPSFFILQFINKSLKIGPLDEQRDRILYLRLIIFVTLLFIQFTSFTGDDFLVIFYLALQEALNEVSPSLVNSNVE